LTYTVSLNRAKMRRIQS